MAVHDVMLFKMFDWTMASIIAFDWLSKNPCHASNPCHANNLLHRCGVCCNTKAGNLFSQTKTFLSAENTKVFLYELWPVFVIITDYMKYSISISNTHVTVLLIFLKIEEIQRNGRA